MQLLFFFCVVGLLLPVPLYGQASGPAGAYLVLSQQATAASMESTFEPSWNNQVFGNISYGGLNIGFIAEEMNQNKMTMSYEQTSSTSFTISWSLSNYEVYFGYHACDSSVCDAGIVHFTTESSLLTQNFVLDASSDSAHFYIEHVTLDTTGLSTSATCEVSPCKIPSSNILDAFSSNFSRLMSGIFLDGFASNGSTTIRDPFFSKPNNLFYDLSYNWQLFPIQNVEPGAIFEFPHGGFEFDKSLHPPFQPDFTLPSSFAKSITAPGNIVLTEYFFSSFAWAALMETPTITADYIYWLLGRLPITLTTSDSFFLSTVPGLSKYPDMNISISLNIKAVPVAKIDTDGVHFAGGSLIVEFNLSNSTDSFNGWNISCDFDVDSELSVVKEYTIFKLQDGQTSVTFSNASVVSTNVGTVSVPQIEKFFTLLETSYFKIYNELDISSLIWYLPMNNWTSASLEYYDGFVNIEIGFDTITYLPGE